MMVAGATARAAAPAASVQLHVQVGHAGDVAARAAQAGDKPICTGSPMVVKTMGCVAVAAFAATAAAVAARRSPPLGAELKSAAMAGSRSY